MMTKLQNFILMDRYVKKDSNGNPLEHTFTEVADRVSNGVMPNDQYLAMLIREKYFVPAGRILAGVDNGHKNTYFNCFVLPFMKDSRKGIGAHIIEAMEIMSHGGGVGTNISTLRPKGTLAKDVGGKSSGSVSWANYLSQLTHLIQQGGSRRGAQMIMINDTHPDIIEFIISKVHNPDSLRGLMTHFKDNPLIMRELEAKLEYVERTGDNKFMTGANISVAVSDKFMNAVINDLDWDLVFPDVQSMNKKEKERYNSVWHVSADLSEFDLKTYETIKAKEIWRLIATCATYSAEPGILFIDRANEQSNAKIYGEQVICTNPCGEQPLAGNSVCNLGALNLEKFVNKSTGDIDYAAIENAAFKSAAFLDKVIDKNYYFRQENYDQQKTKERRVGLGIMGLHDLLIWSGNVYGSTEGNKVVEKVMRAIAIGSYWSSARVHNADEYILPKDEIVKHPNSFAFKMLEILEGRGIKVEAFKNSHLLTIAPTGTTGTMIGTSTGIEPYFAFKYDRKVGKKKHKVEERIIQEMKDLGRYEELKHTLITAMDLSPEAHISVQAAAQKWVDSSISKTINAPKTFTPEQTMAAYELAYASGLKGCTVYRDGSITGQVLSLGKGKKKRPKKSKNKKPKKTKQTKTEPVAFSLGSLNTEAKEDVCSVCGSKNLTRSNGCLTCVDCKSQVRCGN